MACGICKIYLQKLNQANILRGKGILLEFRNSDKERYFSMNIEKRGVFIHYSIHVKLIYLIIFQVNERQNVRTSTDDVISDKKQTVALFSNLIKMYICPVHEANNAVHIYFSDSFCCTLIRNSWNDMVDSVLSSRS